MGVGAQSERVISSKLNTIVNFRPIMSRNFNFAFQIIILRPQEKVDFFGDLCAIFAPSKTQWAIKWECIVMNGYFLSKHIPNDLKTWPKFKKMVLGTIEIWRKCPHLEPLWGGQRGPKRQTCSHKKSFFSNHIEPFEDHQNMFYTLH